jgi:protein-L-isoaspartate(D-aspartate) O-methyltransferase
VKVGVFLPISKETGWTALRRRMVESQIAARGITDERILAAMQDLPREEFVEGRARERCYADEPVQIGYGQTMSQPYMTAIMAQTLALTGIEKVLEVGAGSGYHAALLSRLAAQVYALEIVPELAATAAENLARAGCDNVKVVCADGSLGWPPDAPYDAISVAAGAPQVPDALREQLADGGRLVIPVGTRQDQDLLVIRRDGSSFHSSIVTCCRFVPLLGRQGWQS